MWRFFTAAFRFKLGRVLRQGIGSLLRHPLRSALTMLGIIFGVFAVISMLAIGEGASFQAQERIKRLGSQNIIINSVKPPASQNVSTETSPVISYGLTYDDMERIQNTVPAVMVVAPTRVMRKTANYRGRRLDAQVKATTPWYFDAAKLKVEAPGRVVESADMRNRQPVCVIGDNVATTLFRNQDPLGEAINVEGEYYVVVGRLARQRLGPGEEAGRDVNNDLYIPLTTAQERYGDLILRRSSGTSEAERVELHELHVQVDDVAHVERTAAIISQLLARYHREKDFELVVPLELLRQAEETKRTFNIVLGSIAAISLLVGGIGIMNIMLASVTERTREIGVRRALGAKKRDIISQFLVETALLSGSGGIIGVIVGVAIPWFIERFANMPTIVTLWSLALSCAISVGIGLVFGIYPAYRAANMDPIQALRHE